MGTDIFASVLDALIQIVVALIRIQYSAIFSLIDAIQAFTM